MLTLPPGAKLTVGVPAMLTLGVFATFTLGVLATVTFGVLPTLTVPATLVVPWAATGTGDAVPLTTVTRLDFCPTAGRAIRMTENRDFARTNRDRFKVILASPFEKWC